MDPALVAAGSSGSSSTALLVSLGLMVVIFYFLLIRPQQRRARAQRDGVGDFERCAHDRFLVRGCRDAFVRTLKGSTAAIS